MPVAINTVIIIIIIIIIIIFLKMELAPVGLSQLNSILTTNVRISFEIYETFVPVIP